MRLLLVCAAAAGLAFSQTEARKPVVRVSGEVTAVDAAAGKLTLKSDAGGEASVTYTAATRCLRVPPGEKDPAKWEKISGSDLAVGDRLVARGAAGAAAGVITATTILVMTRTDVAERHQQERADWQKRGILGTVTTLDPATKQITVTMRSREGSAPLVIDVTEKTQIRRYAADSVRFADAKPSQITEIQPGDQVRALGNRSADGTHLEAEQVVSGTFETMAGTVAAVDAAANAVRVTNLQSKAPMTVKLAPDTLVRRLPPEMAAMLARRMGGGAGPGGPAAPGGGNGQRPPSLAAPGAGAQAHEGRPGGGNFDLRQMLERLPPITLADLKPGDAVIVSSTKSNDPGSVTAITIVAGVEPFLAAAPRSRGGQVNLGSWSLDAGMPAE